MTAEQSSASVSSHLAAPATTDLFVCPACHGRLSQTPAGSGCAVCDRWYARHAAQVIDFAGPAVNFDDWWMASPAKRERWLTDEAPREEAYEVGLARRYLIPLLQRLRLAPGATRLLSAGCGLAADVDTLNNLGYETWGIDCGNRVLRWPARTHLDKLARADARQLPFPDAAFDLVISLNTLEHIGVVGDTTTVTPDYQEQRRAFLDSLLRVLRPGGYLLLSGLSRTIPVDVGHVQQSRLVRIHSPWERFLLSYGDVERLCLATGVIGAIEPLPLRGFFSWTTLGQTPIAPLLPAIDWLFGSLPPAVYGSWISPFWIALARRHPADLVDHPAAAGGH